MGLLDRLKSNRLGDDGVQAPEDCQQLVDAWTGNPDGYWIEDETVDMARNSGGLFGGCQTYYSYAAFTHGILYGFG